MAFAQLTYRESLRDVEACFRAMQPRLYHMGIRGRISKITLSDANENVIGISMLILLKYYFMKHDRFMPMMLLCWNWKKPSMPWIQPPLISVYLCFLGGIFENEKRRLSCTHYSIFDVTYLLSKR